MALALRMGCRLDCKEVRYFPFLRHEDRTPLLPFTPYLAALNQERNKHPKGSLPNMLYKEMANSLYGKTAQGIIERTKLNFYDEPDGTTRRSTLPESRITTPHYAALCTGIVRAALSTLVYRLSAYPGFRVLSATTDGAVIIAPRRFNPPLLPCHNSLVDPSSLDVLTLYPEIKALESSLAIRTLCMGRQHMQLGGSWIEVKHIGNSADTMKTRVYSMSYNGVVQHEAHTGFRTDDTPLIDLHACEDIPVQISTRLPNPREIVTGKVPDYVALPLQRRVNTDYDYKRKLLDDGTTVPFAHKEEFHTWRDTAARMRKETSTRVDGVPVKKPGKRATLARVTAAVHGMRMQKGETFADVYRRYIHHAIARGVGGWRVRAPHRWIAALLGISYNNKYKHYRRKPFEPQRFPHTKLLEAVARKEAAKIGKQLTSDMLVLLARPSTTE
jgi:hypothetical protein